MELSDLSSLIAERQSPSNCAYFTTRALQCFAPATVPSWVDIVLSITSPETLTKDRPVTDEDTTKLPLFPPDPALNSTLNVRVDNDSELQHILSSHHDTAFRMFFIRQKNSISRLSITSQLFETLRQQCGIFERIRDYVMCFGMQNGEAEIGPPAMHHHLVCSGQNQRPSKSECVYILRFVEPNNRKTGSPWSIRQTCVYNNFGFDKCASTWLFLTPSQDAEDRLRSWQPSSSNRHDSDPFEVHYILFDVAICSWRRYLVYLAEEIRNQTDRAILVDLDTDGTVRDRLEMRQYLKQLEDNVTELILALAFMLESIDAISEFLREVSSQLRCHANHDDDFTVRINLITKGFQDRRRDLIRFSSQAQSLREKVDSASTLVSNILDLNNGNALRILALESRAENANMAVLTEKSVRDAATVKVLTIVTLVYLPVTVVTNFFSTQFVNSSETSSGDVRLSVIPETWILFAISIPLTIMTVYVWWAFAQREVHGKFPWDWRVRIAKAASLP